MAEDKIHQERIIGQTSAIRRIDPEDSADIENLNKIIKSSEVQKWMEEVKGLTMDDLKDWASGDSEEEYLYAVSGSQKVDLANIGEVQGFVNIYDSEDISGAIEVGYAKRPCTSSGQIASGLRQAIVDYNRRFLLGDSDTQPNIRVVADIDGNNMNSIKVVESAGFVKNGALWELDWKMLNDKLIGSSYEELKIV